MKMQILEFLDVWVQSSIGFFDELGCELLMQKSPNSWAKQSENIVLRQKESASDLADLTVWQSGEAELLLKLQDGTLEQVHFDDMRSVQSVAAMLKQLVDVAIAQRTA